MAEKFYKRKDYGFSVEIWSAKECNTGERFSLACYNDDIQALTEALSADLDFVKMAIEAKFPEDIKRIVEVVVCYDLRLTTRKYGIGHG